MPREGRAYIGFSCDPETKKRALKIASRSGRASLGSICRLALKSYLNRQEYDLRQSQQLKTEEE